MRLNYVYCILLLSVGCRANESIGLPQAYESARAVIFSYSSASVGDAAPEHWAANLVEGGIEPQRDFSIHRDHPLLEARIYSQPLENLGEGYWQPSPGDPDAWTESISAEQRLTLSAAEQAYRWDGESWLSFRETTALRFEIPKGECFKVEAQQQYPLSEQDFSNFGEVVLNLTQLEPQRFAVTGLLLNSRANQVAALFQADYALKTNQVEELSLSSLGISRSASSEMKDPFLVGGGLLPDDRRLLVLNDAIYLQDSSGNTSEEVFGPSHRHERDGRYFRNAEVATKAQLYTFPVPIPRVTSPGVRFENYFLGLEARSEVGNTASYRTVLVGFSNQVELSWQPHFFFRRRSLGGNNLAQRQSQAFLATHGNSVADGKLSILTSLNLPVSPVAELDTFWPGGTPYDDIQLSDYGALLSAGKLYWSPMTLSPGPRFDRSNSWRRIEHAPTKGWHKNFRAHLLASLRASYLDSNGELHDVFDLCQGEKLTSLPIMEAESFHLGEDKYLLAILTPTLLELFQIRVAPPSFRHFQASSGF